MMETRTLIMGLPPLFSISLRLTRTDGMAFVGVAVCVFKLGIHLYLSAAD